jgi:hypothetical protein
VCVEVVDSLITGLGVDSIRLGEVKHKKAEATRKEVKTDNEIMICICKNLSVTVSRFKLCAYSTEHQTADSRKRGLMQVQHIQQLRCSNVSCVGLT